MGTTKESSWESGFFDIDLDQLDVEWLRQPKLVYDYAVAAAASRIAFEQAKADFELVCAELDSEIRTDPEKFGAVKLTESMVKNITTVQPEYQQAQKKVLKTRSDYESLQAVLSALDHRKRTLENLVNLHGQNYFATPTAKGTGREVVQEIETRTARNKVRKHKAKNS